MAFATYIAHLTGKGKDGNPMELMFCASPAANG